MEPEYENYFDVYGEPEGYVDINGNNILSEEEKEQIINAIELDGLWYYAAQKRCKCCESWETVDGIGMVIGDISLTGYLEDLENAATGE